VVLNFECLNSLIPCDALMDRLLNGLKCESRLKTTEKQGIGACSLACSTLRGVKGRAGTPGWY